MPWTQREQFREALGATLAKSQEDRRVFDLVFDRWFFRAAEMEALQRRDEEGAAGGEPSESQAGDGERIDLAELTEQIRQAIADEDESRMRDLAQLAVAAFGRRGEGSGVVGVDVQRIRRSLGLTPGANQPDGAGEDVELDRDGVRRFEAHLRRELERGLIERTGSLPPARARSPSSTGRCRRTRRRTWPRSTARSRC